MLLVANFGIIKWCEKAEIWLKPIWVFIWEYTAGAFQWIAIWQGLDGFQKSLHPCALDESSHSIGRVKGESFIVLYHCFAMIVSFWKSYHKCLLELRYLSQELIIHRYNNRYWKMFEGKLLIASRWIVLSKRYILELKYLSQEINTYHNNARYWKIFEGNLMVYFAINVSLLVIFQTMYYARKGTVSF